MFDIRNVQPRPHGRYSFGGAVDLVLLDATGPWVVNDVTEVFITHDGYVTFKQGSFSRTPRGQRRHRLDPRDFKVSMITRGKNPVRGMSDAAAACILLGII